MSTKQEERILPSTLRRISLGMIPAAAAGLLIITLLIRIHPRGVSVPPCIVTPETRQF